MSFVEFRTIDASQLCRAAEISGSNQIHADFRKFYEGLRKRRNQIAHLNAGNLVVEATKILVDILMGFSYLFPTSRWIEIRKGHLGSISDHMPEAEYPYSKLMAELETTISFLSNKNTRLYFDFDKRKRHIYCPECEKLKMRHDDEDRWFAVKKDNGTIYCIVCGTTYDANEYKKLLPEKKICELPDWAKDGSYSVA